LLALVIAWSWSAQSAVSGEPAASQRLEIRQLLVKYRATRVAARRVGVVEELVAIGPDGVAAVDELMEGELARLGKPLELPAGMTALDERIAALRGVLAELRGDPNLTKEMLSARGVPAFRELSLTLQQRQAALELHFRRLARVRLELTQFVEFLQALQARWQEGASARPALPVQDYLDRAEDLLAKATPEQDARAQRILQENVTAARGLNRRVVAGLDGLNRMRMTCGLAPLSIDPKLCAAAADHCRDMQTKGFFSHESPVAGKETIGDRAKRAGTTASAENIHAGQSSAAGALHGWFLSPGHHKNMLHARLHRAGLGNAGDKWTLMLGR